MAEKLLTKSADLLLEQGYEQLETTHQSRCRSSGIRHTVFTRKGEEFHLGAKEYVYKGLASFGENQVERAVERDAMLVLYIDRQEKFFVFDAKYVEDEGEVVNGPGDKVDDQRWVNVPIEDGADLTGYIYGAESPETMAGDNEELGAFM
jgi:hypothetical protein